VKGDLTINECNLQQNKKRTSYEPFSFVGMEVAVSLTGSASEDVILSSSMMGAVIGMSTLQSYRWLPLTSLM
jgi:hypothetical protein